MAEQLVALADLKKSFADFGSMSDTIDRMRKNVDQITAYNKGSAGSDEIGQTYHSQVDKPTSDLSDLLKQVRDTVDNLGQQGKNTSDLLNNADENAKNQA
ncbi:methyl-accepting chemotaxis protein [Kitasatospora sp. MAP12-15]|uniref:hypothetical protein n=1 Tax=unclassified Kitasatospora TaxID=2633591 RepID=UPI002473CF5D|nr:hypothetical protein [Kitasatospora sp. MAP12-44]MDH6108932.1 methyl-accepting chemotaxis protein [Kitasatospora sp. MAP12-44]